MRAACPLTVVPVCMLEGEGGVVQRGGVVLSRGGREVCPGGGDPVQGEGGVVWGGGGLWSTPYPPDRTTTRDHVTYPMMHLVSHLLPLFSDRMTNACENITFARFASICKRTVQ